jgi:hypothetical protein
MSISNKQKIISANNLIIAENEQKVYDAGYAKGTAQGGYDEGFADGKAEGYQNGYDDGNAEGIKEGIEEGKQAEWSALWDGIQLGGTRTEYAGFFKGEYWNADTFKPKYDITATGSGVSMFDRFNGQVTSATTLEETVDLSELLNKAGVVLDTSGCSSLSNMFYLARVNKLPLIDGTGATSLVGVFGNCVRLHTIEGFKVKKSNTYNSVFPALYDLQNLTMYGTIGQNGFDTHWSTKLSRASIESIVSALSTETSNLTVTFSRDAVNKAFETSEGANDGESTDEWAYMYIIARPNWYFSLG